MSIGDLCYKRNDYRLAYSKGSVKDLIYKTDKALPITLTISYSPSIWVCTTYGATHDEHVDMTQGWDGAQVRITGETQVTIASSYITGHNSLTFDLAVNDPCSAHEDPQVTSFIVAEQGSVVKAIQVKCPLVSVGVKTVTITLANNVMTGMR